MCSLTVPLLLILCVAKIAFGIPKGICQRQGKYRTACNKIFVWNTDVGDFISLSNETMKKPILDRFGKTNRTLKAVVYNMNPFILYKSDSRQLVGYLGDIWNIIQETSGLNVDIHSIKYFDDGEKLIEAGKIDLFLGAGVTSNMPNVYYSQPYLINWYHLYLKTPKVKGSTHSYWKTFAVPLWCAVGGVFAILTLSVFLTNKLLNRLYKVEPHSISLPSSLLGVVSGFINQGFNLKLTSISERIQVFSALLLGVVLYSAMNAVLFSRLAVVDLQFPFKDLWDISDQKHLSLCLRNESFVYDMFKDDSGNLLPEWEGITNNGNCLDITNQSNIDKIICRDNIVVLENRVIMSAVRKRTKFLCDVIPSNQDYFHRGNVFLMAKSLKEKFLIGNIMNKLWSSGIFDRLNYFWIKSPISEFNITPWNIISIQHIRGILCAYLNMLLLSLMILVVEILWKKYRNDEDDMTGVAAFQWIE